MMMPRAVQTRPVLSVSHDRRWKIWEPDKLLLDERWLTVNLMATVL
jgi:hypothetical protein